MSILFSTISFLVCFGIVFSWPVPLERQVPLAFIHASIQEHPESSIFDELNQVMGSMNEQFKQIFNWPKFPVNYQNDDDYDSLDDFDPLNLPPNFLVPQRQLSIVNELENIQKQFDAIQPVCTTITDSSTATSPRKSRRKKLPVTETTTCIKELVVGGRKYYSEEVTTTDENGTVLKHTQNSGSVTVESNSSQTKLLV